LERSGAYNGDGGHGAAPSDEDLMRRAQQEDRAAFTMLMRRYERPLFNYLARMIGARADAEDLVQESFLRVHRHRDRYREGHPFRPWLYRIATNLAKDHLRYHSRRRHASLDAPVAGDADRLLGDALADPGAGPRAIAEAAELQARLEAAVQSLPVKHRTVFLMARYDNMPYDEIARTLRVPVGTVKSRMNKAVNLVLRAVEDTQG
jgi:RNA polymerase sigma-70 factor (ECF subfamily)